VDESLDADLVVRIALFPSEASGTAKVLLKDAAGSVVTGQHNVQIDGGAARTVFHFKKGEVKLWYPVGYGEQPMYDVEVKVFDDVRSSYNGERIINHTLRRSISAKPVVGCQSAKDRFSPCARCGGQVGRPTRTDLAFRNKQHSYLLWGLELDPRRLVLDDVSAYCGVIFPCLSTNVHVSLAALHPSDIVRGCNC
jgi:hypothetical protein